MEVITITANPAIDMTIHVDGWQRDTVNRAQAVDITVGGKGLTVAINLADAGISTSATGFMGADNEERFVRTFKQHGVIDHCIRVPGETRTCVKIVDGSNGETTDINPAGLFVPEEYQQQLWDYIDQHVGTARVLMMGGSLPAGIDKNLYARIVAKYSGKFEYIVVDSSGKALMETMNADILPDMIKPNIHELQEMCGRELPTDADIIAEARNYIARGMKIVVVSMGGQGAWFITKNEAVHAKPPRVRVTSTVGAGDAMVAGTIRGLLLGRDMAEMARTATAYSASNIEHVGTFLPSQQRIEQLKGWVVITREGEERK